MCVCVEQERKRAAWNWKREAFLNIPTSTPRLQILRLTLLPGSFGWMHADVCVGILFLCFHLPCSIMARACACATAMPSSGVRKVEKAVDHIPYDRTDTGLTRITGLTNTNTYNIE